ncbi:Uma2 family endonuclease [Actinoplanes sp. CA-252034]|uniref:Uma2 family endonuclease n=1 Tax=Actinoplanes sp. CA-252034 TaxID=3239906 RepID=UPI003D967547
MGKLREREIVRRGGRSMSAESAFQWQRPPAEGFTADDLDKIPDLPSHAELIDGSLILVSPQKIFHTLMLDLLTQSLRSSAPRSKYLVRRDMSVVLSKRQRPEPDVIVVRADAEPDLSGTWYPAEAVVLAIEVVSPESEIRDRHRKPQLYAEAGIPYHWRVENREGKPVVYAYELDPVIKAYTPITIFRDRVQLPDPFVIDIDLTELERM